MKVNELWLRSFVQSQRSAEELAELLTNAGIEVDALEYTKPTDASFTFKIPPNRGDCLGVEGLAREVAALTGDSFKSLDGHTVSIQSDKRFPIEIQATNACPRYLGCVVEEVDNTVATPEWMLERLETAGIRSVSVVVDIMNYVMLELGQPLHAFDCESLSNRVVVRMASSGEKVTLLDEQEVTLQDETLVIADDKAVHAIAGVMGGLESSVKTTTRTLMVECAYFDPVVVRLAGQHYGLKTDAGYRFERGVDPQDQHRVMERALALLVEITGCKVGAVQEVKTEALPKAPKVTLRAHRVEQLLGVCLEDKEIIDCLRKFQMSVERQGETYQVYPPSYRQDIHLEVDVIEEIARVYGLHHLPAAPLTGILARSRISEKSVDKKAYKACLINRGYFEAVTYSFVDPDFVKLLGMPKGFQLQNPISSDLAEMRGSCWPGLLQAVQYNQHRQFSRVRLFELGQVFIQESKQVIERPVLAGMCSGEWVAEQWGIPKRQHDFFDVKKDVEALCSLSGQVAIVYEPTTHPALHPGQTAKLMRGDQCLGLLGVLHPKIQKHLKLESTVIAFELDLSILQTATVPEFQSLSKYPTIRRDLAIVVDKAVPVSQIESVLTQAAGQFLQEVRFFDIYQGKGIDSNKKSVALGLIVGDSSRTLKESEANDIMTNVIHRLRAELDAVLRE